MHGIRPESVVLCHGCFDVLHLGHKRHLEEARSFGDKLIVSITPDHLIAKGPGRPVFTAEQRREMLLALECVDDVVVSESGSAIDAINRLKPSLFVKGIDYDHSDSAALQSEITAVQSHGGEFRTTRTDKWSSSRIINGERLSPEASDYLARVRDRGWLDQIRAAFERADDLNILFVGETIIDEYRYVAPLAKPSKEFILATVEAKPAEQFLGGIMAASLHADWANVKVVTDDGEAIRKTRFVDADFSRKLFEVYSRKRLDLNDVRRGVFQVRLIDGLRKADCVIVMDFGHGLMEATERSMVENAAFVAVNAQTNAGNSGFNPVNKYVRADLVCVDLPEAQLAAQNDSANVGELIGDIGMEAENVIVTHGRQGSYAGTKHVPAFSTRATDTMGAGDAFLAVAAPLIAAGLDLEIAAFVGNVAGGLKTDIVGHRKHVGRAELMQAIESFLA